MSADNKTYSVAIRTLGLNPEMLRQELTTVFAQTVKPEKVVIYIAKGYKIPDFRVGYEQYVTTAKGMMRQRALNYEEISNQYILFLDDDVLLAPDSAAKLLDAIDGYDCMAPDVFKNHQMSAAGKIFAALSNLTFPHFGRRYAFKIHATGSFSYHGAPEPRVYESQSATGPCSMWDRERFLANRVPDELWLETLGFPYCEDQIVFYKLYKNGGRLGIHYGCDVHNNDGQTSSRDYHRDPLMLYRRAKAQYMVWHRSVYSWRKSLWAKLWAITAITAKVAWLVPIHIVAAVRYRDAKAPYHLIKGTIDGIRQTKTAQYRSLPPYVL